MMATQIRGRGFEVEVRREVIPIEMAWTHTIDRDWRATDSNGHEHYYDGRQYPTLELIVDASHWCDGTEGLGLHDPHEAVDESHYECLQCRETVTPGLHPPGHVEYIAGPVDVELTAMVDGLRTTVALTHEEAARFLTAGEDEWEALAVELARNSERVIRRSYDGR